VNLAPARPASRVLGPLAAGGALLLALAFPGIARATPRPSGRTARVDASSSGRPSAATLAAGLSVGSPTEGHLVGGAHLDESPWLRVTPCYAGEDFRWGLDGLVSLIDHGARNVRKQFPDSVLSVGHLSRRGGGDLERHASHESGRDADVGFYITNQQGKPIYADHFVRFLGDGTAPSWPGARFDDARNWAFVASIVTDGRAHVSYLFVASPLRARLLSYAQKIGAPYATRVRASELMAQPRGALPHDDHFHVRISCPAFMEACVEMPTRNLARARLPRPRSRGTLAGPPANARAAATPVGKSPETPASHPSELPRSRVNKMPPETEIFGLGGSPSLPSEAAPSEPPATSPLSPPSPPPADPPATLEAPIDDVDGLLE
jgi:penicillin-insensitive murein endopeptidase